MVALASACAFLKSSDLVILKPSWFIAIALCPCLCVYYALILGHCQALNAKFLIFFLAKESP